jgi:hypothetical protein
MKRFAPLEIFRSQNFADVGRTIDDREEHQENTFDSIRRSFDRVSKTTSRSDSHVWKHFEEGTVTQFGRQINDSDAQEAKAWESITQSVDGA